ncbi:MAG: orotidine-5'-phosphate decarboxylase [Ardenticatenia bacterium]|nr:orotidine-5'-phosphate decarboxylase [Ardenticatenia bacterium]
MERLPFFQWVAQRQRDLQTWLCLGLDPRPAWLLDDGRAGDNPWFAWGRRLLDATADVICCVKPNVAFYEAGGLQGLEGLRATVAYAHERGLPVILDAKRGDIGSTAEAYARACYEWLGADAVTLNPYLGRDAVEPFLRDGRGVFLLCHTSNPSAQEFQTLVAAGRPLYELVAERAMSWGSQIGLVVGATYPEAVERVRHVAPYAWLLLPGVGAQGGDPARVAQVAGSRAIVPVSRAIATAPESVRQPTTSPARHSGRSASCKPSVPPLRCHVRAHSTVWASSGR